ncbi:penicillin-binding protein, partial [Candidatus Saccharibacteria bacterium]|nr:penicillin-binding protein [Candidatus Saccharibacteria bacterium]
MNKADKKINKQNKPKKSLTARAGASKKMNVYSSLAYRAKVRKDTRARKQAEDLATLPKQPVKRFFARLHPKRVAKYWFSMRGLKMFLKIVLALILLGIIAIGALFLYYKKDLDAIRLDEMKVSETVNVYLDRNGEILWEDKGDGDYRLVAEGDKIATYMRQATVAIEDKNFYNHPGVDVWALMRATISTLTGQGVQGGSTLTQQLIKQVYFSDEAGDRTVSGIPRKIKEFILALEVEKMYDKEQIITMYLNESPYGGRRNGVESGAQAYFGKSAADLTLAEAALLASIPNNPAVLNPYNEYGNEALIARQHKTLDVMVEMGYITEEQAEEAKAVPILDQILPETSQYKDIKAPHFVLEVKKQLEEKYGVKTMRAGGFTIKTTLDYRAQQMAEAAVAAGAEMMRQNGSDNIALSSVDVETGQVIAMVGSSNWEAPVYGEVNAATSPLEPGSSIKPLLDYTPLFQQREGQNYGPGSVLRDENIDKLYC